MIPGVSAQKTLADGRIVCLKEQFYNAVITIGKDESGWEEEYTFPSRTKAQIEFDAFDGTKEPRGWIRHVPTWRRRPGGDPRLEYIDH